ncbi:MAG TPA: hypothetical protein VGR35_00165 [Tepidisphaeraceae bacterium]|nr:hypothetical protein [Tepidisphaeraceae bacterium]
MANRTRRFTFLLAPPVMAASLLAGLALEQRAHVKPKDVEPYHANAKTAIDQIPYALAQGRWTGKDQPLPTAAQKLLRPNAWISRTYEDNHKGDFAAPGASTGRERAATLLIVQCRDSRDMLGHYPPRCYRSHGMEQKSAEPRDWKVGGLTIPGVEYGFEQKLVGQTYRTTVYNFFVVPGGRSDQPLRRDMDAVRDAAEDYQQRYYGAAQFQVVFQGLSSTDLSRAERDDIFRTLIEPTIPVIKTLSSGGLR